MSVSKQSVLTVTVTVDVVLSDHEGCSGPCSDVLLKVDVACVKPLSPLGATLPERLKPAARALRDAVQEALAIDTDGHAEDATPPLPVARSVGRA